MILDDVRLGTDFKEKVKIQDKFIDIYKDQQILNSISNLRFFRTNYKRKEISQKQGNLKIQIELNNSRLLFYGIGQSSFSIHGTSLIRRFGIRVFGLSFKHPYQFKFQQFITKRFVRNTKNIENIHPKNITYFIISLFKHD